MLEHLFHSRGVDQNLKVRGGVAHNRRAQLDRRLLLLRRRSVGRLSRQQAILLPVPDQHILCLHHHDDDGIRGHLAQPVRKQLESNVENRA